MKNKLKKVLAFTASLSMCSSMLLNVPYGTFSLGLSAIAAEEDVEINEDNFPDETFRTYVAENFDTTDDGILTAEEIAAVTKIALYSARINNVSDLTGVEHFTALTELYCQSNQLESLDVSNNTALESLSCQNNNLTSLDVSNNTSLDSLICYNNNLTSLDLSNNTVLTYLDCSDNQLTSLDVSKNTALTYLDCDDNQLTSLDVSKNTALTYLFCSSNQLTSLDVSKNIALTYLYCSSNQLTSLDVSKNAALTHLYCSYNQLTSLDVSKNTALTDLDCDENQLTSLDVSGNTALTDLDCDDNQLTSLDVSKNTALTYLDCDDNQLTSLDVSKNTALEELYCYNNTYNISLQNGTFDLSTLPEGFNLDNASNWDNATIEGNVLTVTDLDKPVTYEYNLGNEKTATFTLNFEVIEINDENFPDEVFRNYVKENNDINQNGLLSATEISSVETIYVSKKSISDLKGIEYFTALRFLNCFDNNLTSLDVSNNTALTVLYCYENQLTSLDLSNNTALTVLYCYENQLTSLDLSNNTALTDLYCYENQLTSLDLSKNTALEDLYCQNNNLTSLYVSNNTVLTDLYCENNQLTSLDVSKNTALEDLYCYNNTYNISLQNGTFDLSILPEGFNLDNASNWDNATIEGNVLTVTDLDKPVTYEYNLGNEKTETFNLNPVSCTISESMISEIANYTYTGEAIEPIIEVKHGEYTLERDVDYTVTFENNINAGTATVVVKAMGTFFNGEFTTEFEINKANPTINDFTFTPPADLIYDGSEKAATVNVNNNILGMGNITIEYYSDETGYTEDIPSAAGEYIVHIIVAEGDNYAATETLFSDDWKFTIKKANPDYIIPIGLTAIYGETLADVELPDGFVWMISPDTSVGNAGKNTFMASYIPEDTTNYVVEDNIEITVDVAKAIPKVSVDIPDVEYTEGDPLPALIGILPDVYEGVFKWITELANGLIAGENELEWQFTPDDTDNYEIVTGTAIINAQTTTTTSSTTTSTTTETTTSSTTTAETESLASTLTTSQDNITETTTTVITTLPQTGFSPIYRYISFVAAAMAIFGILAITKCRKKDEE